MLPLMLVVLTACPAGKDAGSAQTNSSFDNKAPKFNEDSAFALMKTQVAFGPRMPGSEGHRKQLEWMVQFLKSRAESVESQPFAYTTTKGKKLELTNVFARFNSSLPDRVLLIAHWDTRPTADNDTDPTKQDDPISGADDGASGVALLMQIADILSKNKAPIGVDLLFVDGEDWGPTDADMYLGAKHFAANLPVGYKPLYGILVDMIADQNPYFQVESNSKQSAPEVVDRVWRMAGQLGLGNYFPNSEYGFIGDDHVSLNQAGIR
ncbi:MAG TPA: M28 family peptidase, partial [Longimicrobiales bacterium]|nr:M28 family peptidase [Longimicrobiales bacterium]